MKLRRSERMVVISNYLINNPYSLTSLNTFAEKYEAAKSSISEDIAIIKRAFENSDIGHIETVTGASGGVIFTPSISSEEAKVIVENLCQRLSESDRILPGGYIYLSDLLSTPSILQSVGRIIASSFAGQKVDVPSRSWSGCCSSALSSGSARCSLFRRLRAHCYVKTAGPGIKRRLSTTLFSQATENGGKNMRKVE